MDVAAAFSNNGGEFIIEPSALTQKLKGIKVLLFDWDGVFHAGHKNENRSSTFSEADSMGINMLRFCYYLMNGEAPYTAIITGENNETAYHWAKRENLNHVFYGVKDKVQILRWLEENQGINKVEVLFVFDDILDLSLAKESSVRYMVNRDSGIMLKNTCKAEGLCDYITANDAGNHALRELCEMTIALNGKWEDIISHRVSFSDTYSAYLSERNSNTPEFYTIKNREVVKV